MMWLSEAARVLNGKMMGPDVEFSGVSTDSRKIGAGDLFVALRGDNFDGAKFAISALRGGAAAVLLNADSYDGSAEGSMLLVEDSRIALGRLAAHWRAKFSLPVVGLTGSNGKTTVKEMLASVLREAAGSEAEVLATEGNLNNDIGMPLTLLKLRATHRYAVIEMGMNHGGEIDYLTRIACPDVAIINNAAGAHLAGLGTVEGVARAKGEIFAGLKSGGVAVINADDDYAGLWRELAGSHRTLEFGLTAKAPVHGSWQVQENGARIDVATPQGSFSAELQVPGVHNARNALAATAAALALNVPLQAIATGLEKFGGVAGRLQRKKTVQGASLIDDTYNANPASMRAAIRVLVEAPGRTIMVLGDMGELGADAAILHGEIGAEAKRLGVGELLALGELSAHAVRAFGAGGMHFSDIAGLLAHLDARLDSNCTVLVKGSRFMKMERVVQHETGEVCCSH